MDQGPANDLHFSYAELLAEIGAKTLVVQRQNAYILELEAALRDGHPDPIGETEPRALAIASNGAKPK